MTSFLHFYFIELKTSDLLSMSWPLSARLRVLNIPGCWCILLQNQKKCRYYAIIAKRLNRFLEPASLISCTKAYIVQSLARQMKQASPVFFSRFGWNWNCGYTNPCRNHDPTTIFSLIGWAVPEKWLILWRILFFLNLVFQSFPQELPDQFGWKLVWDQGWAWVGTPKISTKSAEKHWR